jgi:hypothetical protein
MKSENVMCNGNIIVYNVIVSSMVYNEQYIEIGECDPNLKYKHEGKIIYYEYYPVLVYFYAFSTDSVFEWAGWQGSSINFISR